MDKYDGNITMEDAVSLIKELHFLDVPPMKVMVGDAFMKRLDFLIQKYGWSSD